MRSYGSIVAADVCTAERREAEQDGVMRVEVCNGAECWRGLRPDEDVWPQRSRLVHLVEHQLSGNSSLWAVNLARSPLERGNVLLDDFVEEHGG